MTPAFSPSVPRGAIRIEGAVKSYGHGGGRMLAVDDCSFEVAAGEICVVVGPSGCGKTTLLNAIAGFHSLDGGSIRLDGHLLCGPGRPRAAIGSDRVVVFQDGALLPWKTNLENVAFGPMVQGTLGRAAARDKARAMLADAGLGGYENVYPGQTSSGVRRRIEIVRALMNDPAVLLLDEPYRALDAFTKSVMHESLLELYARNRVTIFFITHDLEEAIFLGTRVVVMTARPCRPKAILDVGIPYPRSYDIVGERRYRDLVQETSAAVHEERRARPSTLVTAKGPRDRGRKNSLRSRRGAATARSSARHPVAGDHFHAQPSARPDLLLVFLSLWQLGATSPRWLGHAIPGLSALPPPSAVLQTWGHLILDRGYWQSWLASFVRVAGGFAAAVVVGVPFGLGMAMSRRFRGIAFPVFELLRPVPPLAWVPAAIIFWPTQELSIDFVIFLGAFYTIVLNVLGGAETMDPRLVQVARSMGASRWNIFRKLVFRAVLPSILVGMDVSIGITWEVVVAAEMISGGDASGGSSGGGLGFFIWSSYVGGSYPQIIVGMISIGIAGYLSSAGLRRVAVRFLPWLGARS